jgi:cellulose synthase/poly-beta-1,6-N-acetylglucosamine synthase-like glycosyltransferase
MDTILWSIANADAVEILGALWRPFLISMVLYFSGYFAVWFQTLGRIARITPPFRGLSTEEAVDVLLVIPTLLKSAADLDDLRDAAGTVVSNGYPGKVVLVMSIDGSDDQPAVVEELERWAASAHERMTILVARVPQRAGKGVAVAAGLARAEHAVATGELTALPPVFFNMDADGVLAPRVIERMVAKLVRPGWLTRQRPMIVASNVLVRREHYWDGMQKFFTMRYQLALQVAREYMTSISVARNNRGLLPVTGVSGALYATWTELHALQAKHASFMKSLRRRDVLKWWLGAEPPKFSAFTGAPNVEATAGPGDDTWVAWIAMAARWKNGKIDLELPRSPLHAFWRLLRSFVVRPIAYDPLARVYTATPTTVRSLFKQRVRWNTSRTFLLARFGRMPAFTWHLGFWVVTDLLLLIWIHSVILVALLGWPFAKRPAAWLSIVALGYLFDIVIRAFATMLAMIQDHDVFGHRHKLLSLPMSGVFHLVFNIIPTIVGFVHDFLGFGVNTHFAPEETLAASNTGRVALAYRLTRCVKLSWRAMVHGDVKPGWFWLGWGATRWTANGYAGWTNKAKRVGRGGVLPRPRGVESAHAGRRQHHPVGN